ncbi:MAG: sporulation protein YabP [bacterium]|nr:sporulation protein YabP [bacterium]
MPEREEMGYQNHVVHMVNRESLSLTGVMHVDAFDDQEVAVDTELGGVTVRGENLHIKHLNLEDGKMELEGMVDGLVYGPRARAKGPRARGRGWLDRLLR